ncbi:hypothetical protein BEP19_15190 [Ammoniphilus oxalaticus]|uniref:NIPSNAP domain-containing protein n=1 Tax=Ammoniphilus oxalaticus TaxID=66863 RepID=A0A419SD50_9BACL|nr:hypothetical protein BEP19_15190 [Ammoniphilus oxalaticus]
MIKVFMEYKIKPEYRAAYEAIMPEVKEWMAQQKARNYQHFEGIHQPLLFVEMFDVESIEEYNRFKKLRCEEKTFFAECISGGAQKINMWAFAETSNDT